MWENERHLSYGFPKAVHINSENSMYLLCSNNIKSKPNLNFYILYVIRTSVGIGCKQFVRYNSVWFFVLPASWSALCKGSEVISAVLWENPIKHASNIHPDIFNSFYRTVTQGESHRIIYKEILLPMVNPFSHIWTSQQKSPKKVHVISTAHPPPSPPSSPEITLGNA